MNTDINFFHEAMKCMNLVCKNITCCDITSFLQQKLIIIDFRMKTYFFVVVWLELVRE